MQVDFYILADTSGRDLKRTVCQLCEKALAQQMQVFIYSSSIEQAQQLDDLLWSFKIDSFLPHRLLTQHDKPDESDTYPIIISCELNSKTNVKNHPFLINLSNTYSDFFQNFKRIAEMIDKDPEQKQAARKRYRLYLDKSCDLNKYDL